jgi:hypothetical protein
MIQITRRPGTAARSAIYRDLSFFFELTNIHRRDLRNQIMYVPFAGGLIALAQISGALELIGWSVSHQPATKFDLDFSDVRIVSHLC